MSNAKLINATGHLVRIYTDNGAVLEVPPSGQVARCVVEPDRPRGTVTVDGVAVPIVISSVTPTVINLPDSSPAALVVVSRMVAAAAPSRRDLVFPHDVVRDQDGHPLGCRALGQVLAPGGDISGG